MCHACHLCFNVMHAIRAMHATTLRKDARRAHHRELGLVLVPDMLHSCRLDRDQATDAAILQSARHSTQHRNERKRSSRSAQTRRVVFCSADSRETSLNSDSSKLRILASAASSRGITGNPRFKASVTCDRYANSLHRLMRSSSGDALVGMLAPAEGALEEGRIHVSFTWVVSQQISATNVRIVL